MIRLVLTCLVSVLLAAPSFAQEDQLPPLPTRAEVLAEIEAALTIDESWEAAERPASEFSELYYAAVSIVGVSDEELPFAQTIENWLAIISRLLVEKSESEEMRADSIYVFGDAVSGMWEIQRSRGDGIDADLMAPLADLTTETILAYADLLTEEDEWVRSILGYQLGQLALLHADLSDFEDAQLAMAASWRLQPPQLEDGCAPLRAGFSWLEVGQLLRARDWVQTSVECRMANGNFGWNELTDLTSSLVFHEPRESLDLLIAGEVLAPDAGHLGEEYVWMGQVLSDQDERESARLVLSRAYRFMAASADEYSLHDWSGLLIGFSEIGQCGRYYEIAPYVRTQMAMSVLEDRLARLNAGPDGYRIIVGGPDPDETAAGRLFRAEMNCGSAFEAVRQYRGFLENYGVVHETHGMFGVGSSQFYLAIFATLTVTGKRAFLDALNRHHAIDLPDDAYEGGVPDGRYRTLFALRVLAAGEPLSPYDQEAAIRDQYAIAEYYREWGGYEYIEALAWLALALPE